MSALCKTRNTECYSVHGPGDELALLRLELARLGEESWPSEAPNVAPVKGLVADKIAAAAHIRIHGEPIALHLELQHEEAALQLALSAADRAACAARENDALLHEEMCSRGNIETSHAGAFEEHIASFNVSTRKLVAKLKRDAVVAAQRATAIESINHEAMIIAMDKAFLQQEEVYAREVRQLREAERREAEIDMRARMTAEKRVILPDEEMTTTQPYLLSTFERFIPYGPRV